MLKEAVSSLTSWFTPTVFFLLLQLVIATIYITSNNNNKASHKHHLHNDQNDPQTHNNFHFQQQPLARSPSLLHRLKSINFYSYIPHTSHHEPPPQQPPPQQLARSPSSMIQRLKSINLHTYFPTETLSSYFATDANASNSNTTASFQEQPQMKKKIIPHVPKTPFPKTEHQQRHRQESEEETEDGDVVGEIKTNLEFRGDCDSGTGSASMDEIFRNLQQGRNGHFERTHSDTKPASGEVPVKLPRKMKKSASTKSAFSHFEEGDIVERRHPATARESAAAVGEDGEGGGEVDAKADDFINRFKQQLKLQRLDSIMRYKEMIGRGTGK